MDSSLQALPNKILHQLIDVQVKASQCGFDLETMMQTIVDGVQSILEFDGSVIEIADGEDMVYRSVAGPLALGTLGIKVKINSSLSGLSLGEVEPLRCEDTEIDPRVAREACRKIGLRSMVVVPFKTSSGVAGVLKVMSSKVSAFTKADEEVIRILAQTLAGHLHNGELAHQQNSALKEAIVVRDNFLSIASHELKTPLTSLQLQNQMMVRKIQKDEEEVFVEEWISFLKRDFKQLERLGRLINDMLDITRIKSGILTIQKQPFDLNPIIEDVIKVTSDQFVDSKTSVSFKSSEVVEGSWDQFRIEQVISNLLINAIKYGLRKAVTVELKQDAKNAYIIFEDHGMGIAKKDLERIFLRFERAVLAKEVSGMGLGLHIVREIVERHGGEVSVTSEEGIGSRFTVRLPKS
jgi:signal transduction histidine kinase